MFCGRFGKLLADFSRGGHRGERALDDLRGARAVRVVGSFRMEQLRVSENHSELVVEPVEERTQIDGVRHGTTRARSRLRREPEPRRILRLLFVAVRLGLALVDDSLRRTPEGVLEDANGPAGSADVLHLPSGHPVVDRPPADTDRLTGLRD
jgi:hypothetical protein